MEQINDIEDYLQKIERAKKKGNIEQPLTYHL